MEIHRSAMDIIIKLQPGLNSDMSNSNIELTQLILDRHQPGKDALSVLAGWDMQLVRNTLPDVHLLKSMLYDGFSQSDFSRRDSSKVALINQTSFLMQELLCRYLTKVLGQGFITQSKSLFEQADAYRLLSGSVSNKIRDIEHKPEFSAARRSINAEFETFDPLLRDVYLMGESTRILKGVGTKIRALYDGQESQVPDIFGVGMAKQTRNNPFKIPAFEELTQRREQAQAMVEQMSDKELCLRLTRSFDNTGPAGIDVSSPVYGVKTVFAYVPLIMARLMNGWSFNNERVMNDLSTRMAESTTQLMAITARLDRVHEANHQRQMDYISDRFGDGECAVFAFALHQITEHPLVTLNVTQSDDPGLPVGFPRHAGVLLPGNQIMDASGLTDLETLSQKFGCKLRLETSPSMATSIFSPEWSEADVDHPEISEARKFAEKMLELRGLKDYVSPTAKRFRSYEQECYEP